MKNSAIMWNAGMRHALPFKILFQKKQFIIWLMRVSLITFLFISISFQLLLAIGVKGQDMSSYQVTIKLENESLLTGLKKIEAQTSFRFYYRKADIGMINGLNMTLNTRPVEDVLNNLLKNTDLSFRQIDNKILLEKRRQQTGYTIKGRVIGSNGKPVELATIKITKSADHNIAFTALADTGGRFNLKVFEKGEYLLSVTSPETDSLTQAIKVDEAQIVILPDIILTASIRLKGVTITDRRPLLSRYADKLTLNVEGSVYERGENALKLFSVIPGVYFDGKEILFRGSEGVTVYVDNRKIPLSGDQLLSYLRSIPSESIKSYELKAVPGAENDAQNNGVVINIVLKSEYKFGLSGNVSTGYWYNGHDNTKATTFLNYRTGKFNLQGGFNYFFSPAFYEDDITQKFDATGIFSRQTEQYLERYHNIGYNAAIDYKLNSKQTVGVSYNRYINPGSLGSTFTTDITYLHNAQTSTIDSSSHATRKSLFSYVNQMANAFYRNKLDSAGSRLDIGYSYISYGSKDPSALETRYLNSAGAEFRPRDSLFAKTLGKSMVHVANIDLEKHLSKSLVFSAGSKFTSSKTDYSIDYRNGLDGQAPLDPKRSNSFRYNENILAFYSTLAQSYKNLNVKFGLRTEQTNYSGRSIITGQTIGRNQWDFFPSAFLNRKFGEEHSFTLSYDRRIDRPGFRQLNPFVTYTSLNSIEEGNAELRPYYSNNLQLEYLLKSKYTLTVGYQNTTNGIASNVTNIGNVIISKDENISDNNNVFLSLYIPIKLTSWWEFNTSSTFRYRTLDLRRTDVLHREKFTQNLWGTNKFNLPNKYFIEVSGFYNGSDFHDITNQFSYGKLDVTIKKSFFNNQLTSSLELQDPFKLYKPRYQIITPEFNRDVIRNRLAYVRYIGIFLTYNFSGGKKQNNKEDIDAAGNEARGRL
ncbi:outer membrane beta-barrel family protein [Mucilaginibacter sp. UR6-11]|uniref:outer membrane beta-barrel family protein n=1 Tax=Mucilaginibacter sp. UR6-11 TaxID=1435644 RepID=UPI001E499D6B|nr:outer membrane beta-barrel family protein [Mucilaginibacter sp. UR6-11]MCC8426491.1 TonB-dependent receptor family protein [Mucilaginibacter sp. UR6-11]